MSHESGSAEERAITVLRVTKHTVRDRWVRVRDILSLHNVTDVATVDLLYVCVSLHGEPEQPAPFLLRRSCT